MTKHSEHHGVEHCDDCCPFLLADRGRLAERVKELEAERTTLILGTKSVVSYLRGVAAEALRFLDSTEANLSALPAHREEGK